MYFACSTDLIGRLFLNLTVGGFYFPDAPGLLFHVGVAWQTNSGLYNHRKLNYY
jgi:hypothetical protein